MNSKPEIKLKGNILFLYAAVVSVGLSAFLISMQVSSERLTEKAHISWLLQIIVMIVFISTYLTRIWSLRDTQLVDENDKRYRAGLKASFPFEIALSILAIFGFMGIGSALTGQNQGNSAGSSFSVVSIGAGIYALMLVGWLLQTTAMWLVKAPPKKKGAR